MKRLQAVFNIQISQRGCPVRRKSTNHLGSVETTATAYSHTRKPLMGRHTHTAQGKPAVTEVTARTYDGWGRPVAVGTIPPTDELNRVDYCGNMVYESRGRSF